MELRKLVSTPQLRSVRIGSGRASNPEITSLAYDSRQVVDGTLFFAIAGGVTDGHTFISQALQKGAVAIASERDPGPEFDGAWVKVGSIRPAMAEVANRFYRHPSRELALVGITGTNGKTTTSFLVHSILKLKAPALLMGTIKTVAGDRETESVHTTPEAIDIQRWLREAVDQGCEAGAMEVSSHALALYRVFGCHFGVSVFTNLTQDHLDFHGTFEEYFRSKQLLFDPHYNPGLRHVLVNWDDSYARRITASAIRTFSLQPGAEIFPIDEVTSLDGTDVTLQFFGRTLRLQSSLVGGHNIYNLMSAAGACSLLGISDEQIQEGIRQMKQVPGRFEKVDIKAPFWAVVDYAHTPDALENVLRLTRNVAPGRIVCVFGCGGDRDRKKRPIMGAIAAKLADQVVVTSDNPRSEEPEAIIAEIVAGIGPESSNYEVVVDRKAAIKRGLEIARPGDVVLVAGKGHETYQIIKGQKTHFDDREAVKEFA